MENNMNDIINNLKKVLNNSQNSSSASNDNSSNLNITPEMIQNLASKLQNSKEFNNTDNCDDQSNSSQATSSNPSLDIETIMKFKNIIDSLNQNNDPRSNLLYSLKPYLREKRQKKIDQYVNLFKITQISTIFKKNESEN